MKLTSSLGSRLAANYVILSAAEFVSKVMAAVAFAYLARVLGPASYGYLEFAVAIAFVLTLLVDGGLNSFGAKEIAKGTAPLGRLIVHITFMRFVLAILATAILALLATVIDQSTDVKRLILLYALVILSWPMLVQWVFQGRDLMHFPALMSVVRWTTFTVSVILFVRNKDQVWLVPIIEGVAVFSAAGMLIGALAYTFGLPRYRLDIRYGIGLLRAAIPIGGSELLWAVKVYFATIVLGILVSGSEVGYFGSAHRIVVSLHTFVWLYFYNLLPSISRTSSGNLLELQRLMRVSMQTVAWPVIFFSVFATAFAELIISSLYGAEYGQAVRVFQVLIWLIPVALLSGHYRYSLIGYDKQRLEFVSSAAGAGTVVILNLILVPTYGLFGAAWSLLISEMVVCAVAFYFTKFTIVYVPFLGHTYRAILAGAIVAAILHFALPINPWFAAGLTTIVFSLLLLALHPNVLLYRGHLESLLSRRRPTIS